MKRPTTRDSRPRRSKSLGGKSMPISVADDWAVVASADRGSGRHALLAGPVLAGGANVRRFSQSIDSSRRFTEGFVSTAIESRIRELADAQQEQRRIIDDLKQQNEHAHRRQAQDLEAALQQLSSELRDAHWMAALRNEAGQLATLRRALDAVAANGLEIAATATELRRLAYEQLVSRVRATVERIVPPGARILVVSEGDSELLKFSGRTAAHFLQAGEDIAGHPADSTAAVAALDRLRSTRSAYLVFPKTVFWWFAHYDEFTHYLNRRFRVVVSDANACVIYALKRAAGEPS